jgi:acyl-coenzyme A synthetase/AMP-(fatty) acid ligase
MIEQVPKNQSGKILRRVLKAVYEGKDPGDTSTME